MKIKMHNILSIIEILINISLLPLFNIKLFHEVAVLPSIDENGNMITKKFYYYYSIIDNLKYDPVDWIRISVALIIMSIIYCILSFFIKHKNMKIASHIFAICSILFFLLVLFLASLVRRNY